MTDHLPVGSVISGYPYLWRWQRDRRETEGRKNRPACVAVSMHSSNGLTHLVLLPITSTPPYADQTAIKLPTLEIKRIHLDPTKDAWIIVSEYNYDIVQLSYSLQLSNEILPTLSPAMLKIVLTAFRAFLTQPTARIDRL